VKIKIRFRLNTLRALFLFALLPVMFPAAAQSEWLLKNEKQGVKVYYRQTSDIHEIKLTTSVKSSVSGLLHLFAEVDQYPQWGYRVVESKLVRRISDTELIYYSRLDFPWPLSDRDVIMHSKVEQDPVTKRVTSISVSEPWQMPEVKDVVRIRDAHTKWVLYPNDTGWLYLEYFIYSNPGGMMPDWLVNMAIDVGPMETINSIRKILSHPRYQQVKLAFIKD
jgi:hypothetical protein